MIMVFAMSLVVSIVLHVVLYAGLAMKEINVIHAEKGFTSAMVSQMVKLIHLLVLDQYAKVQNFYAVKICRKSFINLLFIL